ncbi:MAG: energy transducer TonB [Silvibacterium sp.]
MTAPAVRRWLLPGLLGLAGTIQAAGQAAPASEVVAPGMPRDPNALMRLAARVKGLVGADMKPWHLKAAYQTFDWLGGPQDQGTFEEWWAGPERYKISYSSGGFNQVQYTSGEKTSMTGDVQWPPLAEAMVEQYLVHPLLPTSIEGTQKYVADDVKIGALTLKCLRVVVPPQYSSGSAYCIDTKIPVIRVEVPYDGVAAFFNDTVSADGRYVAKRIRVQRNGKPLLNVDLTVLEFPPKIEDADFAAPASATAAPERNVDVSASVIAGSRISGIAPEYPALARNARVEGTVVLRAIITREGKVDDLRVLSGPPMLQEAALDSVTTWRYRPYLLNGVPVTVETEVNVVFTLKR